MKLRAMSCDAVAVLFRAAVAVKNRSATDAQMGSGRAGKGGAGAKGIRSIDDLQAMNTAYWEKRLNGGASH